MPDADDEVPEAEWRRLLAAAEAVRGGYGPPPCDGLTHPLACGVYAPLLARMAAGTLTLAQVGQSLDGRIATESGHSHYINAGAALRHLHRLRALADAVVIGAGTAVLDDPQLTTRRVPGPDPLRVVLDPRGRVPKAARMFDGAAPTLVLRAEDDGAPAAAQGDLPPAVEIRRLPTIDGRFPPAAVLQALHARGLRCVLIEGGGETLSMFLRAGLVERLHVMLAPMLIGPGRTAFHLPALERLDGVPRFTMTAHALGPDVLLDCDLEPPGRG